MNFPMASMMVSQCDKTRRKNLMKFTAAPSLLYNQYVYCKLYWKLTNLLVSINFFLSSYAPKCTRKCVFYWFTRLSDWVISMCEGCVHIPLGFFVVLHSHVFRVRMLSRLDKKAFFYQDETSQVSLFDSNKTLAA